MRASPRVLVLALFSAVYAILPATPADAVGDTVDTNSTILVSWFPFGSYTVDRLAFLSSASQHSGLDEGALTRFSDAFAGAADDDFTTTPWIAYISCDLNPNLPSNTTDDTFTLAKRRGAVAALLYSLNSTTCTLNPEFKVSLPDLNMDIYSTTSTSVANLVNSLFTNTNASFGFYNATLLNASSDAVSQRITGHNAREPSYVIATLQAENASQVPALPGSSGNSTAGTGAGGRRISASASRISQALVFGLTVSLICSV
ncbi:hypothetical protein EXIGLDRAFT_747521 [Exidia glandulosa HHB12029]|uniref:Uncharacterized protein n=1 Tax=Exidia glandulosa HHB12029 TaxID=1314781 RepID=A0A165KN90_EXIGL|nr:hypothetical protein EXIGLDRAFT_747521 [Exidia glandulosa HHB12029]